MPGYNTALWGEWQPRLSEAVHMGSLPILDRDGVLALRKERGPGVDPKSPPESAEDGCPGAWYRSDFASSVARYERTIISSGVISNPYLDRTDDPLVIEAAAYLESERLRHRNYWESKFSG